MKFNKCHIQLIAMCIYIYINMYAYIQMCVCVYICIYIYIIASDGEHKFLPSYSTVLAYNIIINIATTSYW